MYLVCSLEIVAKFQLSATRILDNQPRLRPMRFVSFCAQSSRPANCDRPAGSRRKRTIPSNKRRSAMGAKPVIRISEPSGGSWPYSDNWLGYWERMIRRGLHFFSPESGILKARSMPLHRSAQRPIQRPQFAGWRYQASHPQQC